MAVPEQAVAPPPRHPTGAATLSAANAATLAAGRVEVEATLASSGMQARAIAEATSTVVEALAQFAQGRRSTIIPMLQYSLVEHFSHRTPDQISLLLGKETAREREFLRRQARRIERDLPKVLAESDLEKRADDMRKLMAREKRYMAQREKAMSARAHSMVDSLDLEEASPAGAMWMLGGPVQSHTPGCLAMAGKVWPWPVLRDVIHPPVHPGCPCWLMSVQEAITRGLLKPGQMPDLKDAMLRARHNLALEEAIYELVSPEEVTALLDDLLESKHHGHGGHQKRYSKGLEKGGEFAPKAGGDFRKAGGLLKKLLPGSTQRGAARGRHVWLKGHETFVPEDRDFKRNVGGVTFTSPAGGTNIYREHGGAGQNALVSVPGEAVLHPDLKAPAANTPAAPLVDPAAALPAAVGEASAKALADMTAQIQHRLEQPKKGAPVSQGQDGKAAHDALLASGFVIRPSRSKANDTFLRMSYISKSGHQLGLDISRKTGKVQSTTWGPDSMGGLYPDEWKMFQAGKEPPGFGHTKPYAGGGGSQGTGGGYQTPEAAGGHTGGSKSLFKSDWKPAKPYVPTPPPPPVVHPALIDKPEKKGVIPNYDHVALEVKGGPGDTKIATAPDGSKYVLKTAGGSEDRVASELLSSQLYAALGANVPAAGVRHIHDELPDFASIPDVKLADEVPIAKEFASQRVSTGIIIRDADGNITIFEPKNHYMGYEHTFPKGGVEYGLTEQQNAHKELWEETGLHAKITGVVGDYQGQSGVSRYYTGVLTGGEVTIGDETQAVKTVTPEEAATLLNKERDKQILADLLEHHPLPKGKPPKDTFPGPVGKRAAVAFPVSDGKIQRIKEPSAELGQHFMADALLGNWEFLGKHGDETTIGSDGKPIRENLGGTLSFRENGETKPFGPVPTEVWTMLSPKGAGFGTVKVSDEEKRAQATAIAKALTPAKIDKLVNAAPFKTPAMRDDVRQALKSRVAWMGRYGKGLEHEPEVLTGADAAAELTDTQRDLELFPEQEAALSRYGVHELEVNDHLRSGKPKAEADENVNFTVKELDGLLKHTQTQDEMRVFVGIDLEAALGGKPADQLIGQTMSNKGYMNMALSEEQAQESTGVMRILIPAGAHALYTRGIPGVDVADEVPDVISARGAKLRIVGQIQKDGKTYIDAVMM